MASFQQKQRLGNRTGFLMHTHQGVRVHEDSGTPKQKNNNINPIKSPFNLGGSDVRLGLVYVVNNM